MDSSSVIPSNRNDDEDEPLRIFEGNPLSQKQSTLCIVASVWTHKSFNAFGFLEAMCNAWSPKHGMTSKEIKQNLFAFNFNQASDMEKVFAKEPWHFKNNLVVLKELESAKQPSSIIFTETTL